MGPRARKVGTNAAAVALATVAHIAIFAYFVFYLRPFEMPPMDPPMVVELVQIPPIYLTPPPRPERLDPAELKGPPSPQPTPVQAAAPLPAPTPTEIPPPQPTPPNKTVAPTPPIPRPEVLAADIPQIAQDIKPEFQAPRPVSSALLRSLPTPDFAAEQAAAEQAAAAAAQQAASATPGAANAPPLRSAAGGAGGVDDRWRVKPDGFGGLDCPPISPDRMTASQRERCVKPVRPPLRTTEEFPLKDPRFDEEARRKALLRTYKSTPAAQYPGLRCTFGGKCAK